jgi:hypothetical protein
VVNGAYLNAVKNVLREKTQASTSQTPVGKDRRLIGMTKQKKLR